MNIYFIIPLLGVVIP